MRTSAWRSSRWIAFSISPFREEYTAARRRGTPTSRQSLAHDGDVLGGHSENGHAERPIMKLSGFDEDKKTGERPSAWVELVRSNGRPSNIRLYT